MIYLIIIFILVSFTILFYGILKMLLSDKLIIKERIEKVKEINEKYIFNKEKESLTLSERVLQPLYKSITSLILKLTPKYKINKYKKELENAGLLKNNNIERWLYIRLLSVILISSFLGLLTYLIEPNIFKALLITIMLILLINFAFRFYIASKITARKNSITKDLPFTLDLITVSVEAGLSFDGAIARVVNNIQGDLSSEFGKTLKEIRMGIERKIALRNMSDRCGIKEISTFITSIIQADDLGVSLSNVLRIESEQLREQRKQAAREKAMKAPIKMLFPLIIFIFPTIFVIILGPAVIKIMEIFK